MKTSQIMALASVDTLEVSRFDKEHYVLRKQCKRLVDAGALVLSETLKYHFIFQEA
jgi:hypothetical protein